MNMVYLPAGRKVWQDVALMFVNRSIVPAIWMGDPIHDEFARENFKDCLVLNVYEMHISIDRSVGSFSLPDEILEDKRYYVLKDQVYKAMDRQDEYGEFGRLEREAFFYSLFVYFITIVRVKKIELLVSSEAPHSPVSLVLYGVCKLLGVATYHLTPVSVAPAAHISKDLYGEKILASCDAELSAHRELMVNYVKSINRDIPVPFYIKRQQEFDRQAGRFKEKVKKYILRPVKERLLGGGRRTKYGVFRKDFFLNNTRPVFHELLVRKKRKRLVEGYREAVSSVEFSGSFVYVPLHYEPERTTNPEGGDFYNAYDMLMWLRSFVPGDIPIVIKEHTSQFSEKLYGYRGRSPLFYRAIKTLNNIRFAGPSVPSGRLIDRSLFVATQAGTAALEASLMGKKSLIFGCPWFFGAPNVYFYKDVRSFDALVSAKVVHKSGVERYLLDYISDYAIPVCVNPSGETSLKRRFGERYKDLAKDECFSKAFTELVSQDFVADRLNGER